MEESLHPQDENQRTCILVTGANSGLGLGTCERLIDDFIHTRPNFESLTLICTTRGDKKAKETSNHLRRYIDRRFHDRDPPVATRITIQSERLDLTSLQSVYALAERLPTTVPHLDAIILNAGTGGEPRIQWGKATWSLLTNFKQGVTHPTYRKTPIGLLAPEQRTLNETTALDKSAEQPSQLGLVFTANVFGHYVLVHLLTPLLASAIDGGRVIFVSSLEAYPDTFHPSDFQGLQSSHAYEASKRLTDLLVLTSQSPSSAPFVNAFLNVSSSRPDTPSNTNITLTENTLNPMRQRTPALFLVHPGICATSFVPLPLVLRYAMVLAFYIARVFLGSQWHTISAHKGAVAATWLALTSREELEDLEIEQGKAKWGSCCDWLGRERVVRTAVEGWGRGGGRDVSVEGRERAMGTGKRDREAREKFDALGRECWMVMEDMRIQWDRYTTS